MEKANIDEQLARSERLSALVSRLSKEADQEVARKAHVEKRMLEDLQQYHGQYEADVLERIAATDGSQLFINMTRPKTNALAAKMGDLLFPTDDRNWGIEATPEPSLSKAAQEATEASQEMQGKLAQGELPPEQAMALSGALGEVEQVKDAAQVEISEAKKRAEAMTTVMDDQLKESSYQAAARDAIEDICKLGTGIMKGPILTDKAKRSWRNVQMENGASIHQLVETNDLKPEYRRVDPWHFFPSENGGDFERHLLTKRDLRKLAKQPGFDADAIAKVLVEGSQSSIPSTISQLRAINGENDGSLSERFLVWEYNGPIEPEEFADLESYYGEVEPEEIDPLLDAHAVIWFCGTEIIRYEIYPFDSGDSLYSMCCLEKDETGSWGYGLPSIMRDSQSSLNAAWRMMLDNSRSSAGPQIVVNKDVIEPEDGDWTLRPSKVWTLKNGIPGGASPFNVYHINNNQSAMANIVAMSQKHIDDETALPAHTVGEPGSNPNQTAMATAIMSNNSNVVMRRVVKNFDDDMTVPNIKRLYDWNMQHHPDDDIKGDMSITARGSSVLLVREMQARTLIAIALQLGAHPIYGPMFKHEDLIRKIVSAHMISPDDVMLTAQEIKANQQPAEGPDIEAFKMQLEEAKLQLQKMKIDADVAKAQMQSQTAIEKAQIEHQTAMIKLADELDLSIAEIQARIQEQAEKRASDERRDMMKIMHDKDKMAFEGSYTERFGPSGGGLL